MERSVGHALAVVFKLEGAGVKLGVNHPVMPPHADQQSANENDCQPAQYRGEVKDVFQHCSPHGLHQPCNNAAVRSEQQPGADGYAVNDGHLVPRVKDGGENATCGAKQLNRFSSHAERTKCESCESTAPYNLPLGTPDKSPEPTQHLRLRVVWQGLLC